MLYIHKLSDLSRKSAETESVMIIRDLRQRMGFPISVQKMEEYFGEFLISETDTTAMLQALALINPTLEKVKHLAAEEDAVHEPVNLQRTTQILSAIPNSLLATLEFSREIADFREEFFKNASGLLNQVPRLRTNEEKKAVNEKISALFEKILRNKEFGFNYTDVVNESHVSNVNGLHESMLKGYFFHISLEEELKKASFEVIKERIPADKLQQVDEIAAHIATIKKGVERAYDINMRMVNSAIQLYSCVKWVMNGP